MRDLPSERAVVGAALLRDTTILELDDEDFTDRDCQLVARTIRDMIRRAEPVDQITVAGKLFGRISAVTISDLEQACPVAGSGHWYGSAVRRATRARLAHAAAQRLAALSEGAAEGDHLAEAITAHTNALSDLPPELGSPGVATATIADLLQREYTTDWLVPDLVERGERIVLTAAEGTGKSVISTQWAVAFAAGCHPWTGQRIGDGRQVLLIDAENSEAQTQRRYRWIGERFTNPDPGWAKRIHVQVRPEGLDLPGRDRGWLAKVCNQVTPDLICFGPAYKLMRGDPQKDSDVLSLLATFDQVRVQHGAALLIETHTGHAKDGDGRRAIRPYGSSVWLRWPEIGVGLRRSEDDAGTMRATELEVAHWRGTREDRDWPDLIRKGRDHELPWTPVREDYWGQARRNAS